MHTDRLDAPVRRMFLCRYKTVDRLAATLLKRGMTIPVLLALVPHTPLWATAAARDIRRVQRALGDGCRGVHHVGSTSVPGIAASPIVDLLAEVHDIAALQASELRLSAHGFGVQAEAAAHRRLYHVDDLVTRQRRVELRCYKSGHPEAEQLLALYAYFRAHPEVARAYEAIKREGRIRYGHDVRSYLEAKRAWIEGVAHKALAFWRRGKDVPVIELP